MIPPAACLACLVNPQTASMLVPLAQATVIAVPVLLRKDIASAIRRLRDKPRASATPGSELATEPEDQPSEEGEPPGGIHP
jgi:hypothetical protein